MNAHLFQGLPQTNARAEGQWRPQLRWPVATHRYNVRGCWMAKAGPMFLDFSSKTAPALTPAHGRKRVLFVKYCEGRGSLLACA